MAPIIRSTRIDTVVNPQDPSTWLAPDQPLIGSDGRDWAWCYVLYDDVPGYPGTKVGTNGSFWSSGRRNNPNSPASFGRWWRRSRSVGKSGYENICLCRNNVAKSFTVHSIVLAVFYGPCPEGMECCHWNGNRIDNRFRNLRWATRKENGADRDRHGTNLRGERGTQAKLTEANVRSIRALRDEGWKQLDLAQRFGVSQVTISEITLRKTWTNI